MAQIDHSNAHAAALKRAEAQRKQEEDEKATVWAFVWTLFAFKVLTVVVIVIWIDPLSFVKWASLSLWPFLLVPAIAVSGPVGYQIRKRRLRRKREALKSAEFFVNAKHES